MIEMMQTAYVFPGQGAQSVGMGRDLYQSFEVVREVFKQADERLGFPLSYLCFEGPEDELLQTINTQPAIVMVSFACLKAAGDMAGRQTTCSGGYLSCSIVLDRTSSHVIQGR